MTEISRNRSKTAKLKLMRMISAQTETEDLFQAGTEMSEDNVKMTGTTQAPYSGGAGTAKADAPLLALGTDEMIPSQSRKTLQNAFQTYRTKPAQRVTVEQSEISQLARRAVEAAVDRVTEDKLIDYLDTLLPARVNHVFDDIAEPRINTAVKQLAPSQITQIVEEITPQVVGGMVKHQVESSVNSELQNMTTAVESSVAHLVRKELHGAFGSKVTDNIKSLIRIELSKMLKERGL